MRKFCWLYRNKNNGEYALVQRPQKRSLIPIFQVMNRPGFSFDLLARYFRDTYVYLMRVKKAGDLPAAITEYETRVLITKLNQKTNATQQG